ncbi:hypothetical protein FHS61_002183 [Altererythrobacter atlanticus]|uniref:Uncharacterized protein n=1 Tax=Croceibacterium atlanticum TaxID=1267766 RepID=A0A0F7KM98_9SPHN|nr:hypothetical protein [Croceibacterium atlanticum]AKH41693.1 hypothetical protein WYH_00637 [Croceibacterium atlanticum]MBB5733157.1 hypothetical protein [Croceibacterium atlanticum]
MKKITVLCGLAVLAACSSPESNDADAEGDASAAPSAVSAMAGSYEIVTDDGTISSFLAEDGSYIESMDGDIVSMGSWREEGGKTCFDPTTDEPPMCYTIGDIGDDGTFTATPDEGDPITVKKVD